MVLILAIGIGANTAVFSVVNSIRTDAARGVWKAPAGMEFKFPSATIHMMLLRNDEP